ncbi:glycosyltransferase [Streptomyces actuosus]|uniref:D-inositol 3-phosphate glycosyltransferase n=1 Tax=Streptomyces actuosus TaxID=1885 RepID=A0ABS2VYL2_STRAS|nr:glycosyltransferase [Streptomyces actuosus]MBN0048226.1 glycosyltransferase [Streptomyces actuosus]
MAADRCRPRVLLLTSGPVDGGLGGDTDLAMALARGIPDVRYHWFRKWPRPDARVRDLPGAPVPLVSLDGVPRLPERMQAAAVGTVLTRRSDLVHAVLTIGSGFPRFSRVWPRLLGGTPVLHTVPGVMDPALLAQCRPLGPTVALSEVTAQALRTAGFEDVRVIPPVVPLDAWPRRPRPSTDPPTVLVTGHHDEGGGAEEAVASAAVASRAGARFRLVLALRDRPGQDTRARERALRAGAARAGLPETEVLGHVDDMHGLLAAADVLLYVPRVLGGKADIPLTVLQALATGRPVILSELPQFEPLHDTVVRATPGDCLGTGRLLSQLWQRPGWWQQLAERGRAAVEEHYGEARFLSQYTRLYQELLP